MSKYPFIKFYIGDWEQDLNDVSGQAEYAWFKIILKMHQNDQSGIYQNTKSALKRLWKLDSLDEVEAILTELKMSLLGDIKINGDIVQFVNRRMVRAKKISEKRAEAGSSGGNATQQKLKSSQEEETPVHRTIKIVPKEKAELEEAKFQLSEEPEQPAAPPTLNPYLEEVCKRFSITDHPQMHIPKRTINSFLDGLSEKDLEYFKSQTEFYFKLKELNGQATCNWRTWIQGTHDQKGPLWKEQDYHSQYVLAKSKTTTTNKSAIATRNR